jgi:hypothetical protein
VDERPALRASDVDRERVATLLRDNLVAGRLTADEFSERVDAVHAAVTMDELERLTLDLPAGGPPAAPTRSRTRWTIGVMSGTRRRSHWRIEGRTTAVAFMGGCVLDLRHAELAGPEATIVAVAFMGGIEILVPEGLDVDLTGFAFMGSKHERGALVPPPPGATLLHVRAFALMGGVEVRRVPAHAAPVPALP